MLYQKNWDKVKERLLAIWENEIIDRCCISVTAKIDRNKPWGMGKPAVTDEEIYNTYIDKETVRGNWEAQFANTYFGIVFRLSGATSAQPAMLNILRARSTTGERIPSGSTLR